jgi:hypothetical protein
MDAGAAASPIAAEGMPLLIARPVAIIRSNDILPHFASAYSIVAMGGDSTSSASARLFVGSDHSRWIAEVTRDGALVDTFTIDGIEGVQCLSLHDGRLFALSSKRPRVAAITVTERSGPVPVPVGGEQRLQKAWMQMGVCLGPIGLRDSWNNPWMVTVIDEWLVAVMWSDVLILPLARPFH